jgi:hypothetical protein
MKKQNQPAAVATTPDNDNSPALLIGSIKFTELTREHSRTTPNVRFSAVKPTKGSLRFNAPMCQKHPELLQVKRARLYSAAPANLQIALFPDADGLRMHVGKSGDTKITGAVLTPLGRLYRRITYKLEPIASPRAGWLLLPLASERRAGE